MVLKGEKQKVESVGRDTNFDMYLDDDYEDEGEGEDEDEDEGEGEEVADEDGKVDKQTIDPVGKRRIGANLKLIDRIKEADINLYNLYLSNEYSKSCQAKM